jgi:hypothetical protein
VREEDGNNQARIVIRLSALVFLFTAAYCADRICFVLCAMIMPA